MEIGREFVVEPVSVVAARDRLTTAFARQAVRYATSSVYFLDDRSFPAPEAFWTGGARSTSVVFDPDDWPSDRSARPQRSRCRT